MVCVVFVIMVMLCGFIVVINMLLVDVIVISFFKIFFIMIFVIWLFGEMVGKYCWGVIVVGFFGVLLMLWFDGEGLVDFYVVFVFISVVVVGMVMILV